MDQTAEQQTSAIVTILRRQIEAIAESRAAATSSRANNNGSLPSVFADFYDRSLTMDRQKCLEDLAPLIGVAEIGTTLTALTQFEPEELFYFLHSLSGSQGLKYFKPLYAAVIMYSDSGVDEDTAVVKTKEASGLELMNPQNLLVSMLQTNASDELPTPAP